MVGLFIGAILIVVLFLILGMSFFLYNKAFGSRFECDPLVKYYTAEEFGLEERSVDFYCKKIKLKGYFYSYTKTNSNKIVIFCHGMWSSHKAYIQDIEYLCRNGFQVFTYDCIGTDESEGKSIGCLSNGVKSLDAAVNYIKDLNAYSEISCVGHSWGGYSVLGISKLHEDIKSIVAISPFYSIPKQLQGMLPKALWIFIPFVWLFEVLRCGAYALGSVKKGLNNYRGKILIVHSMDDPMVKYETSTKRMEKSCKNSGVSFLIVEDKLHNPQYTKQSVVLLKEYSLKLRGLAKEEADNLKRNTDFHALGKLDSEVMNKIVNFIK